VSKLSRYDRATIALWARSYAELLGRRTGPSWPAPTRASYDRETSTDPATAMPLCIRQAAAHAVLVGLRGCADGQCLFERYAGDARADFALIDSLVAPLPVPAGASDDLGNDERRFQVRDVAFHLRWLELTARGDITDREEGPTSGGQPSDGNGERGEWE